MAVIANNCWHTIMFAMVSSCPKRVVPLRGPMFRGSISLLTDVLLDVFDHRRCHKWCLGKLFWRRERVEKGFKKEVILGYCKNPLKNSQTISTTAQPRALLIGEEATYSFLVNKLRSSRNVVEDLPKRSCESVRWRSGCYTSHHCHKKWPDV